jgi:Flp pilus assembly protein TadD
MKKRLWAGVAVVTVAAGAALGIVSARIFGPSGATIASSNTSSEVVSPEGAPQVEVDLRLLRAKPTPRSKTGPRSRARKKQSELEVHPVDAELARRHSEALEYLRSRRYVNAAHTYRVLLSRDPTDVVALAGLGQAQLGRGNDQAAVRHLRKAVALRPENLRYRVLLAGALLRVDEREEARRECEEVLRRDPENEAALRVLRSLH